MLSPKSTRLLIAGALHALLLLFLVWLTRVVAGEGLDGALMLRDLAARPADYVGLLATVEGTVVGPTRDDSRGGGGATYLLWDMADVEVPVRAPAPAVEGARLRIEAVVAQNVDAGVVPLLYEVERRGAAGGRSLSWLLATAMALALSALGVGLMLPSRRDLRVVELLVVAGPEAGRFHRVDKPLIRIGRRGGRPNDVEFDDPTVSRQQATLRYDALTGRFHLENEAHINRTVVNGAAVDEVELRPGDRILIGRSLLEFRLLPRRRRGSQSTALLAAALAGGFTLGAGPSRAADDLTITRLETRSLPQMRLHFHLLREGRPTLGRAAEDFRITLDDQPIDDIDLSARPAEGDRPGLAIVLVIEADETTRGRTIGRNREAALALARRLPPGAQLATMAAVGSEGLLSDLSSSRDSTLAALRDLAPTRGRAASFSAALVRAVNLVLLAGEADRHVVYVGSDANLRGVNVPATAARLTGIGVHFSVIATGSTVQQPVQDLSIQSKGRVLHWTGPEGLLDFLDWLEGDRDGFFVARLTAPHGVDGSRHRLVVEDLLGSGRARGTLDYWAYGPSGLPEGVSPEKIAGDSRDTPAVLILVAGLAAALLGPLTLHRALGEESWTTPARIALIAALDGVLTVVLVLYFSTR